jgi:hypothetical protein
MKFEIKGLFYVVNSSWDIIAENNIHIETIILLNGGVINMTKMNISNSGEDYLLDKFEFLKCENGGKISEADGIRVEKVKSNGKSLFNLSSGESNINNSVLFFLFNIIINFSI